MRPMPPLLVLVAFALLGACAESPLPARPPSYGALPALGSPIVASARPGAPVAPVPGASVCVTVPGRWPGELTGCYDADGRLQGVELDAPPESEADALAAVIATYAPGAAETLAAVGGNAWVADGVRLEVVRDGALLHVRARREVAG